MANISQNMLVEKLEMLIELCVETEPTPKQLLKMSGEKNADMTDLFTPELIDAKFYLQEVLEGSYEIHEMTEIMRGANTIWRWRMKVKKDGWPDMSNVEYRCGELLKQKQKINAIKLYRQLMIDRNGDCGLREAKEWVDKLQIAMGLDN